MTDEIRAMNNILKAIDGKTKGLLLIPVVTKKFMTVITLIR